MFFTWIWNPEEMSLEIQNIVEGGGGNEPIMAFSGSPCGSSSGFSYAQIY